MVYDSVLELAAKYIRNKIQYYPLNTPMAEKKRNIVKMEEGMKTIQDSFLLKKLTEEYVKMLVELYNTYKANERNDLFYYALKQLLHDMHAVGVDSDFLMEGWTLLRRMRGGRGGYDTWEISMYIDMGLPLCDKKRKQTSVENVSVKKEKV